MPIYLYYCEKCNTKGEYLVPLSNPVPEKCFECKRPGIELKRVYDGQRFGVKMADQNSSLGK